MNLKETYDKIAADWHNEVRSDGWWKEGTDVFISKLGQDATVLDVGCGSGIMARVFQKNGLKVSGFDFSSAMIDLAKKQVPGADFFVMDLDDIPRLNKVFHGIYMRAVLLHVPKTKAQDVVHALADKLKPGGFFYIAVKEKELDGPEEEMKKESDYGYEYERFFSYFSLDELRTYFKESGLDVIYENTYRPKSRNWIQVIAQKPCKSSSPSC